LRIISIDQLCSLMIWSISLFPSTSSYMASGK